MKPSHRVVPLVALVACGSDSNSTPPGVDGSTSLPEPSSDAATGMADAGLDAVEVGVDTGAPDEASGPGAVSGDSVVQFHNHATRDGLYTQSTFTKVAATGLMPDTGFAGTVSGKLRAQLLFVDNGPDGKSIVIATTENNQVTALDATTGVAVWEKTALGAPADSSGAGCGNISPLGITGTGVIDPASRTFFVSAVIGTGGSNNIIKTHQLHALSIDDGSERVGFPVDLSVAKFGSTQLEPVMQNQRGALLFLAGVAYVPFGGHFGDCGEYHGWVVGVPLATPTMVTAWASGSLGGAIWAPGGLASDGTDLFAASGNTFNTKTWAGGEAILRFQSGPVFSGKTTDYFAPYDWPALDLGDVDIGGSGPLLIDVPGATPSQLVVSLGKNGKVYLLDRSNLGGIGTGPSGDGVFNHVVATGEISNAAASVTTASGTWVIFHGYEGASGVGCKTGSGDLVALKITATSPPTASAEWCADSHSEGEPMITTTDGKSEAIVWVAGDKLRGWDVETGAAVFTGGSVSLEGAEKFTTPIAAKGRIYVGNDNQVYAFKL